MGSACREDRALNEAAAFREARVSETSAEPRKLSVRARLLALLLAVVGAWGLVALLAYGAYALFT